MTSWAWGDDPNKWILSKSSFGRGWMLFPPHDGEASLHASFAAAVAVFARVGKR